MGHWLVQPFGAGCGNDGNRVPFGFANIQDIPNRSPSSSSFACANFISTAATIGTSYEPNSRKTIGIYAAVLIAQGIVQPVFLYIFGAHNLDVGTINTFGVRILKYLNTVSVWWHAIGTTSIAIAILAAAPKHQSAKFVFQTFIDGTGVDGVGWSQRASPAYVAVIGILLAQYTLSGLSTCVLLGHFSVLTEFQASMRART